MDDNINILEILTQYLGTTRINSAAWHTDEYCRAEEAARCANDLRDYIGEKTQLRFNEYTSAASAANDILIEIAYQQGMKDLAEFVCSLININELASSLENKDRV